MELASIILQQLGGGRFIVMTGAKNLVGGKDSLHFSIPKARKGINKVRITLDAFDTYTVEFFKFNRSKLDLTLVEKVEGVYNDMLQEVFTNATGLYTKL